MAYFPNGSAGDVLLDQCGTCILGGVRCPVRAVQAAYNYRQLDSGQEHLRAAVSLLVDDNGICQVRQQLAAVMEEEWHEWA